MDTRKSELGLPGCKARPGGHVCAFHVRGKAPNDSFLTCVPVWPRRQVHIARRCRRGAEYQAIQKP